MDYFVSRESELEVDLESGGNTSEEDRTEDNVPADQPDIISERVWSGVFGIAKSEKFVGDETVHSSSMDVCEDVDQNVELSMYKNSDSDECVNYMKPVVKKQVKDKCKKISSRNPHKPPRPPKGPSLDAADRKLIKEITELAVRKRARAERMKALKKMKASKALPSSSSLSGMLVTLVFCLVLIYQGLSPGSSPGTSAIARTEDLISVQLYSNFSAGGSTRPGSTSQNSADNQVSGSDLPGEVK